MKKLVMTMFLIAVLGLIATTAVGFKGGANCGNCPKQSGAAGPVTAETQSKYADSYATLEKKLEAKRKELSAAWGKDSTTVGEINKLRGEMFEIKKEYQLLEDKVRMEMGGDSTGNLAAGSGQKGFCTKQGMQKKGCGKKARDCGMRGGKANCLAVAACPDKENCDRVGNCRGQNSARCGDCWKQ